MKKNKIGLDVTKAKSLAANLDDLLANYQLFYINARGFHWNIKGSQFFELHVKFEELYNDSLLKIDEIAERILTLGHQPSHTFKAYLAKTEIPARENVTEGNEAVQAVIDGFSILLKKERALLNLSEEAGDEGTNALMSDYIRQQEKLIWMYSAYLN